MGNSHGRFVWYELMTTDMKTAKLFYANVVGWGARDASAPALGYSLFTVADLPVAGLMNMPEDRHASAVVIQVFGVGCNQISPRRRCGRPRIARATASG
jgi:predicted enzyme related to lactoylglutathione lyase